MNGTELKTVRQSLFLSVAEAANINGVRERVYRYWEAGEWVVPDDVAARMDDLDRGADAVAAGCVDAGLRWDRAGPPLVLFRFACDEDLWAMFVRTERNRYLHGMPANVYAAGLDRARRDLRQCGRVPRIVTMDRQAYGAWLDDRGDDDNARNRSDWAATVTDPPTRAKRMAAENQGHPSSEENQA